MRFTSLVFSLAIALGCSQSPPKPTAPTAADIQAEIAILERLEKDLVAEEEKLETLVDWSLRFPENEQTQNALDKS
ncbi:MAG: hypothetical protein ACREHD_00510 [Pirellulales bacterium]